VPNVKGKVALTGFFLRKNQDKKGKGGKGEKEISVN
jgi:hypothetical protein